MVEHTTENRSVDSSILSLATNLRSPAFTSELRLASQTSLTLPNGRVSHTDVALPRPEQILRLFPLVRARALFNALAIPKGVPLTAKIGRIRFDQAADDLLTDYKVTTR